MAGTPILPLIRRRIGLAYAAFLLVLLGVSALDREGLRRWRELDREVKRVQQENREIERENARMRREVKALHGDPAALERAAREELGYVKPGEIILKLDGDGGSR